MLAMGNNQNSAVLQCTQGSHEATLICRVFLLRLTTLANKPTRCDKANLAKAAPMYIIAIAWLYFVIMLSVVSDSILKGVVRFLFLGALPAALVIWMSMRKRSQNDDSLTPNEHSDERDTNDT
jgi:biotin transporter BioY